MTWDFWNSLGDKSKGKFGNTRSSDLFDGHFSKEQFSDLRAFTFFSQLYKTALPERFYEQNGFAIGFQFPGGRIIYLLFEFFQRHLALIGKTRSGKTTFLLSLILFIFYLANSVLVVIDRGDLISSLLKRIDRRFEDIILVRVSDTDYPVSINLLQLAHYKTELIINEIIRMLNLIASEKLTDRMVMLLRKCILALLYLPGATLADIEPFLFNEAFRNQVLSKVNDPELVHFWRWRYLKDEKIYRSSAEGIITRLWQIIGDPFARRMLCQKQTRIPFEEIINGERFPILLLDLNSDGKVSSLVGDVIARVFLIIIHSLALSRAFHNAKPIFIFADEIQTYFEPSTLSEILARGAKHKVHLACAFQYIDQLGSLWSAVDGNAAATIAFTAGAEDAQRLAKSFPGIMPSEFVELPRFQAFVRINDDQGTWQFKIKTFPPPEAHMDFQSQIIQLSRIKYARSLAEVEADFQTRREEVLSQDKKWNTKPTEFEENIEPLI